MDKIIPWIEREGKRGSSRDRVVSFASSSTIINNENLDSNAE